MMVKMLGKPLLYSNSFFINWTSKVNNKELKATFLWPTFKLKPFIEQIN